MGIHRRFRSLAPRHKAAVAVRFDIVVGPRMRCRHFLGASLGKAPWRHPKGFTIPGVALVLAVLMAACGTSAPKVASPSARSAATLPANAPPPAAQSPTPVASLDALECPIATHCLAAGSSSSGKAVVENSTDAGRTWSPADVVGTVGSLAGLACATQETCVAVGGGAVVRSTDGGQRWHTVATSVGKATLTDVACPTATTCVATAVANRPAVGGTEGVILVSDNAGSTWSDASVPPFATGLYSVACTSAKDCLAVGGTILFTTDGGTTWQNRAVAGGMNGLSSIACPNPALCLALGPNPAGIYNPQASADYVRSLDGGHSFTHATLAAASATLWALSCSSATACVAGGNALPGQPAAVFATTDGGSTWQRGNSPAGVARILALSCSAATCVAAGTSLTGTAVVASTANAGQTWQAGVIR